MPSKIDSNNSNMPEDGLEPEKKVEQIEKKTLPTKFLKRKVYFSRVKRKIFKHVWLVRSLLILIIVFILSAATFLVSRVFKNTQAGFYTRLAKDFVFTPQSIINPSNGGVNILILGKGGKGHDAPDLTDTIIFSSVNHESSPKPLGLGDTATLTMISLPRDIWIYDLKTKLNSIYYWGNKKEPSSGGV
jgi:anionic cell wall polymer biosynthesis LytR-Cps2A-Psr (LCP) family protein